MVHLVPLRQGAGVETTRPEDDVELRAVRDGNSIVIQLTRATAEAKKLELESEGWAVEIRETHDR
jgi:hypothetical protein